MLMCQIDDQFLEPPFFGVRQITRHLRIECHLVNEKRIRRRMRLWRSLKYECVYLHAWETGSHEKAGVGKWIEFYNRKRPHSALGGKSPAVVNWLRKDETQTGQQVQRVA